MQKQDIYLAFRNVLLVKIGMIRTNLEELKEMGKNETKSTAGDKHETALAMLQLEQEKMRNQLSKALQDLSVFEKIDPENQSSVGVRGSLVITDKGIFFLSIALGKIQVSGETILALSPDSPLGAKLMGCKAGETITMNSVSYFIETVS